MDFESRWSPAGEYGLDFESRLTPVVSLHFGWRHGLDFESHPTPSHVGLRLWDPTRKLNRFGLLLRDIVRILSHVQHGLDFESDGVGHDPDFESPESKSNVYLNPFLTCSVKMTLWASACAVGDH